MRATLFVPVCLVMAAACRHKNDDTSNVQAAPLQQAKSRVESFFDNFSIGGLAADVTANVLLAKFAAIETASGSRPVRRSPTPKPLVRSQQTLELPAGADDFLRRTGTGSLVVIKDGQIVHESYYLGADKSTKFASWSVAKSYTSALIGAAVADGFIQSVDDLATKYVPEFAGTAYERATIKDILTMSSGIDYDEDYANPLADVHGLFRSLLGDMKKHILTYKDSKSPPGERNSYRSVDTLALGVILRAAIDQPIAEYLEKKLWHPLGAESDASWLTDKKGLEATFCCIMATTRDYAKLGLLYLNGGNYDGRQILPAAWVRDSLDFSAPRLRFGENALSDDEWGYGYQWWMPTEKTFSAIGIFNQYVYVDPAKKIVIAKNSANPTYLTKDAEDEHTQLFQKIIDAL